MPFKESKYDHHRQEKPENFDKKTFKTVNLSHTDYHGEKFDVPGAKAVVGKEKESGKWKIQSILTPKDPKTRKEKADREKKERGFIKWLKGSIRDEKEGRKRYKEAENKYPEIAKDLKEFGGQEQKHENRFEDILKHEKREHERGSVY